MIIQKPFLLLLFLTYTIESLCNLPLIEQFKQAGYVEMYDKNHCTATFDSLYALFDDFVEFLQKNPVWAQKLYTAKERFIRSKERHYYSTDFFGFYDESKKGGRGQIAFYYSTHFHDYICSFYKEFNDVPQIMLFLEACCNIQRPYANLFAKAAAKLGIEHIFSSEYGHIPILFKVIKYLPSYRAARPHYDGTALTFFLDSTDNRSLLISPYMPFLNVEHFYSPSRELSRLYDHNSILLIPGAHLTEFSIWPTPHIVTQSGAIRHAAIAFAMRPHFTSKKNDFSPLPHFHD